MATIIDTEFLTQKLTTWMASKGFALEATLLAVILILTQIHWIQEVSSNRHTNEQYYPLIQLK